MICLRVACLLSWMHGILLRLLASMNFWKTHQGLYLRIKFKIESKLKANSHRIKVVIQVMMWWITVILVHRAITEVIHKRDHHCFRCMLMGKSNKIIIQIILLPTNKLHFLLLHLVLRIIARIIITKVIASAVKWNLQLTIIIHLWVIKNTIVIKNLTISMLARVRRWTRIIIALIQLA